MNEDYIVKALEKAIEIIKGGASGRLTSGEMPDTPTLYGGVIFKKYLARVHEWRKSNDKFKKEAGENAPEFIVVRKDLTDTQNKLFIYNENYNFMQPSMREKGFGEDGEMGAYLVFPMMDESKKPVPNHLVACAGNHSKPEDSRYQEYLDKVENSALRWLHNEYIKYKSLGDNHFRD